MTQTILQTEHPNRNSKLQSFRIPHPMGRSIQTFHAGTVREKTGIEKVHSGTPEKPFGSNRIFSERLPGKQLSLVTGRKY